MTAPTMAGVIPTRGRPKLLGRTLESLRRADLEELIIVDDNPEKSTHVREIAVAALNGSVLRYRVVRSGGVGPGLARNLGATEAASDLLWFIDDDIEVPSSTVAALKTFASDHPGAVLGGGVQVVADEMELRLCINHSIDFPIDVPQSRPCGAGEIWACNMVVPRELFDRSGGFSASAVIYGEEFELLCRLASYEAGLFLVAEASIRHIRDGHARALPLLIERRRLRGRNQVQNARTFGWDLPSPSEHLKWALRGLAHSATTRCVGGRLEASQALGRIGEQLRLSRRGES